MARRSRQADAQSLGDSERQIRLLERAKKIQLARTNLIDFAEFMMPDPEDMDDATRSLYRAQPYHILLAEGLERVDRGECLRLGMSLPPQHGKTRLASVNFAAWYAGRHSRRNTIFAAYNETYASKIGGLVRGVMQSPQYAAVFPHVTLDKGSRAKDALETCEGGQLNFVGRGGSGTGLPADLVVIDDPIKGDSEANSPTIIESLHDWYSSTIYSRVRATTAIVIIHTRWVEDDLLGRMCDPDHPWRQTDDGKEEAARWDYINIPAVLFDGPIAQALNKNLEIPTDPQVVSAFGKKPMAALWPEEFNLRHLASAKKLDKNNFEALYQGHPNPEDGDYFKAEGIVEYQAQDLPRNLRIYGASDHAITEKKKNDPNVIGCVGVDEKDHVWIFPDLVWERMETDRIVEELIAMMRNRRPLLWWMESENISKSFGPFLYKRMMEEKVYCAIDAQTPSADKRARARAIQGRMSMKMVHFPAFAPWWPRARAELLKFPRATHDDFVDWLAWIGRGLMAEVAADAAPQCEEKVIKVGSISWIKAASAREERQRKMRKATAGF